MNAPRHATFAARLKALRTRAGRPIPGLAAVSGLTPQAVHQLERGERRPTRDTVCRLADALDLTPNDFLPDGR